MRITRRASLALPFLATPALGQNYPSRPIRAVVPFPAGGGVDTFARAIAPALTAALGQPVVVENIGGASSRIGTQVVTRAAPDGLTILITNDTLAAVDALPVAGTPALVPGLAPVLLGATAPQMLITHPRSGIRSAADYTARIKGRGAVHVGVPGLGSSQHFASELLGQALGGRPEHVPYRGGGPLMLDLIAGTIDAGMVTLGAGIDQVREGRLVALGVTGAARSPAAPDTPAFAEAAAPGFAIETWMGILAPAGTPAPILAALHAAAVAAIREAGVVRRLDSLGFAIPAIGPEPFGALLRDTVARFADVAGAVGIRTGDA
ncbi:Bug family tripartite tricarboxylate transporter substrate binding protein [Rhodovarius crocodyli]|nr:tripartite tricarboxylate transporter substrate-binding protein [Rhodovarius crocodyli]